MLPRRGPAELGSVGWASGRRPDGGAGGWRDPRWARPPRPPSARRPRTGRVSGERRRRREGAQGSPDGRRRRTHRGAAARSGDAPGASSRGPGSAAAARRPALGGAWRRLRPRPARGHVRESPAPQVVTRAPGPSPGGHVRCGLRPLSPPSSSLCGSCGPRCGGSRRPRAAAPGESAAGGVWGPGPGAEKASFGGLAGVAGAARGPRGRAPPAGPFPTASPPRPR